MCSSSVRTSGAFAVRLHSFDERSLLDKEGARDFQAFYEADARTRTGDPFITSEVLYQLSYVGEDAECSAAPSANLGSEPLPRPRCRARAEACPDARVDHGATRARVGGAHAEA
jgi:hypothetical protein